MQVLKVDNDLLRSNRIESKTVKRHVVLLRAHIDDERSRQFLSLLRSSLPFLDVVVVSFTDNETNSSGIFSSSHITNSLMLKNLPYIARLRNLNPENPSGYHDLPVMSFFIDNPHYDFYWVIEYDVMYSGNWCDLFSVLNQSQADLLGTTVQRIADNPAWCHWDSLNINNNKISPEFCVKAFTPFIRLSKAALTVIHGLYVQGLDGHYEATWGTSCALNGLCIEDLGGNGPFTPLKWRNKHYRNTPMSPTLSPGSFVFRPEFNEGLLLSDDEENEPLLWHPIKS